VQQKQKTVNKERPMIKEKSIFNTVRSKIDVIRNAKTTNELPREKKDKFLNDIKIILNVIGEMEELKKDGLHQFSKQVSILIYMLLSNQKLLDKIVDAILQEVINDFSCHNYLSFILSSFNCASTFPCFAAFSYQSIASSKSC